MSRQPAGEIVRSCALLFFASTLAAQVPYERILNSDREPGNWLTYSRNYQGHRFSPLDQTTAANVGGLKVKWAYQFRIGARKFLRLSPTT